MDLIGVHFFKGPDKGFLHNVLGVGAGSGVAESYTPDSLPVALVKAMKGVRVAVLGEEDCLFFVHDMRCFQLIIHGKERFFTVPGLQWERKSSKKSIQ